MRCLKKFCFMFGAELYRIFVQPWFYLATILTAFFKFISVFGEAAVYETVFEMGNHSVNLLNIVVQNTWSNGFLSYIVLALCAFPVVGNYVQDIKTERITIVLPRMGFGGYAVCVSGVVCMAAFLCVVLGDCILYGVGHFCLRLPFYDPLDAQFVTSDLLENGHFLLFFFVTEILNGMQGAFLSLLVFAISFWIKDVQILTVLPMILWFLFVYWTANLPSLINPKQIYWYTFAPSVWSDGFKAFYAILITVLVVAFDSFLLYQILKKQYAGIQRIDR